MFSFPSTMFVFLKLMISAIRNDDDTLNRFVIDVSFYILGLASSQRAESVSLRTPDKLSDRWLASLARGDYSRVSAK